MFPSPDQVASPRFSSRLKRTLVPGPTFRSISIGGSYVGSLAEMRELVALAAKGEAEPVPVETRPLDQAQASLDDLVAGRVVGRVVLTP